MSDRIDLGDPGDPGDLVTAVRATGIDGLRVVFVDQHGELRGKTVAAAAVDELAESGIGVPASLLHKDTGGANALDFWNPTGDPTLDELIGAQNLIVRPDPATFIVLPWAEGTGLVLGDIETRSGTPIPHSPREVCRGALDRLAGHGFGFRAGLELEFHLYLTPPEPGLPVPHSHPGWDLLGEDGLDRIEPVIAPIRAGLAEMGWAPRTIEAELGPSQIEMSFDPADGLAVADQAVLVRAAIRHLARRHGHHATFMSRPAPGGEAAFPSGWHLHQSLTTEIDGSNALVPDAGHELLSEVGGRYLAGLLEHAASSCLLTTPTVNGYKRYRPRAVAPDRITWGRDNRGALLRVVGDGGPGTRIENRGGDPAANPYFYVTSQVLSGLDGIERDLVPPPPTELAYEADAGELLPRSLGEAIDAFAASALYRERLGDAIVEYLLALKRSEWHRFTAAVTDWEQREYFGRF